MARADGIVPKSNAARRNELRMRGIHVFDTYAGALACPYCPVALFVEEEELLLCFAKGFHAGAALELFMLGLLDEEVGPKLGGFVCCQSWDKFWAQQT